MNLRSELEIINDWKNNFEPLVSICCITYNHENYISDAIESFLLQKTTFPFEVIVGEDCSLDCTREVIEEYRKKYPNLIKIITSDINVGIHKNFTRTLNECSGKYIAFCEGDDYWTDPEKLQIQVDFLESNDEYVISGHDASIVDFDGCILSHSKLQNIYKKDFSRNDLMGCNAFLLTLTWVFKNIKVSNIDEVYNVLNVDTFLLSYLGQYGKSHYHSDISPAIYRVHDGGVWSKEDDRTKYESSLNTLFWIYSYHKRIGNIDVSQILWNKYINTAMISISTKKLVKESILRFFHTRKLRKWISKIFITKKDCK